MRLRDLSIVSALTVSTALLVACGTAAPSIDDPAVELADAEADASVDPLIDGEPAPIDAAPDAPPDAPELPCFEGDVTVYRQSDAAPLESITCIRGSLTIWTADPIALPRLREVSGSIVLQSTSPAVSFPGLEAIGTDLRVQGSGISTLSLPLLRDVAGALAVSSRVVTSIDAPRLESVGSLVVEETPQLQRLSLPVLKKVLGGALIFSRGLVELSFPNLERIEGSLGVARTTNLTTVNLPRLREVVADVRFSDLGAHTISVTFPALERAGSFSVAGRNHHLAALFFPILTRVGPITIDAAELAVLSLPALVECGGLEIDDVSVPRLRLPELKKVEGSISLRPHTSGGSLLTSIEFPKLEEAESLALFDLSQLVTINLAQLRSVTNDFQLARAPRLTELSLPALTSTGRLDAFELATITTVSAPLLSGSATTAILLGQAPTLTHVSFPSVTSLERLQVGSLARLTTLTLPAVTAVKSMEISGLPALTRIAFPALQTVKGITLTSLLTLMIVDVPQLGPTSELSALVIDGTPRLGTFGSLAIAATSLQGLQIQNTAAVSLAFPNLVSADHLLLSDNYALTGISFPALRHVSTAEVKYAPKLPQCAVDAINANLVTGWISTSSLAACTP